MKMSRSYCDSKKILYDVYAKIVPMNTKTFLGISLAAAFAISMFAIPGAIADDARAKHLVNDWDATNDGEFLKVTITADGPIKNNGQLGAYGYGVITDGGAGNNVLALTTHNCASDSPYQGNSDEDRCPFSVGLLDDEPFTLANDGPRFHAHILDLKASTSDCQAVEGDSGFEVDVASSVASNGGVPGVSPDFPIKVNGKQITVGMVPIGTENNGVNDDSVEAVASFEIYPLVDSGLITNLCLVNLEFQPAA
jgi:hypothetical protein